MIKSVLAGLWVCREREIAEMLKCCAVIWVRGKEVPLSL